MKQPIILNFSRRKDICEFYRKVIKNVFGRLDKIELTRENVIKFAKYDYVSITGRRHMFGEALSYILKILDKKGYLIGKYNIRFVWGRTSYTKQWNYFQKLLKKIKK